METKICNFFVFLIHYVSKEWIVTLRINYLKLKKLVILLEVFKHHWLYHVVNMIKLFALHLLALTDSST